MMSLWDALRMNMMISYQELVRTFLNRLIDMPCWKNIKILPHKSEPHDRIDSQAVFHIHC
ncbi:hypothetical protein EAD42_23275 [Salmonella enterica]|nr:hypothetical protein [Salmonella enterica]